MNDCHMYTSICIGTLAKVGAFFDNVKAEENKLFSYILATSLLL